MQYNYHATFLYIETFPMWVGFLGQPPYEAEINPWTGATIITKSDDAVPYPYEGSYFKSDMHWIETTLHFDRPVLYNVTMTIDEDYYCEYTRVDPSTGAGLFNT